MDKKIDMFNKRSALVKQANDFIINSRYTLSAQEMKIVQFIISYNRMNDTDFKEYQFDIQTFCFVFGIKTSGQNYDNLKTTIKSLADKSFWMKVYNKDVLYRWFDKIEIDYQQNKISLKLNSELKPMLLQLQTNFTAFELGNVLVMKSKYAIRLYQKLKAFEYIGTYKVELEELKASLETAEYDRYNNFKVFVLDKAIEEINKYTDITVSFIPVRQSRKIVAILFTIKPKDEASIGVNRIKRNMILDKGCGLDD